MKIWISFNPVLAGLFWPSSGKERAKCNIIITRKVEVQIPHLACVDTQD